MGTPWRPKGFFFSLQPRGLAVPVPVQIAALLYFIAFCALKSQAGLEGAGLVAADRHLAVLLIGQD